MGRLREDGGGVDKSCSNGCAGPSGGRWRGRKITRYHPLMVFTMFVIVVGVTMVISTRTPLGSAETQFSDLEEKLYKKDNPFATKTTLQKVEDVQKVNPYTPVRPNAQSSSGWSRNWQTRLPGVINHELFSCDRSHIRTDVCRLHGIVQLVGNDSFVLKAIDKKTPVGEERIKPYTRKWEESCMDRVAEITFQSELGDSRNSSQACQVWHRVPAVVFSTGGYTGNVYHEFHDGLIPLYITTQHLKGEVIFIVADYHDWWMFRYQEILKQLSNYEVIDISNYTHSRCFLDVTAGLFIHAELGIDNTLMPNNESIQDFRVLLSRAYQLEEPGWKKDFPTFGRKIPMDGHEAGAVPQLVIINREENRAIVNLNQVIELATKAGFSVTILKPDPTTEMKKIFWLLDRCDVLLGVHGAALTHFLFMRPGSIFIQIVPLGTDWAAHTYYGDPAMRLGLHYLEYKITVEESSLSKEYKRTDPVLVNPNAVVRQGWSVIKEIYLSKQSVYISLPRFSETLEEAKAKWKAKPAPQREKTTRRHYKSHKIKASNWGTHPPQRNV